MTQKVQLLVYHNIQSREGLSTAMGQGPVELYRSLTTGCAPLAVTVAQRR